MGGMHLSRVWKEAEVNEELERDLSTLAGITPTMARLLARRGVERGEVESYFSPSLSRLADPFALPDMDRAVSRVVDGIRRKDRILVHGDYDADGITACALLLKFFKDIRYPVDAYLPNRLEEGHGIGSQAVDLCVERGINLVITVDCGITSFDGVERLREKGIEVIVLDHHTPSDHLPAAYAIVDPKLPNSRFEDPDIAGVGVAFFFLLALRKVLRERGFFTSAVPEPNLGRYLGLVALGTVADIVPLRRQNRILVAKGLGVLERGVDPGIMALKVKSGLSDREIGVGQVAFGLGPRINAAGRLGMPQSGLNLLLSESMEECIGLAAEIERCNQRRQSIEESIFREASSIVESLGVEDRYSIVLAGDGWHSGVVGIVASRIVEMWNRPVVILCREGELARGSARGIKNFNMLSALDEVADCLLTYGGHSGAAGLTLESSRIQEFALKFDTACREQLDGKDLRPVVYYDKELDLSEVNEELVDDLTRMRPFGTGNPEPLFLARDVRPRGVKILKNKHFKVAFEVDGSILEGIGFNQIPDVPAEARWDILFTPMLNSFKGRTSLQLNIKDFRIFGVNSE